MSLLSVDTPKPYFSQPPSPHPLLLCAAPLIHNGMSHALKRPLSWVHFCERARVSGLHPKIILPFFFLFSSSFAKPARLLIIVIRVLFRETIVKSPPGKTHQRVFFSTGSCTTAVCVEAVRRAPALIRHKQRKQKNHSAFTAPLSSGADGV